MDHVARLGFVCVSLRCAFLVQCQTWYWDVMFDNAPRSCIGHVSYGSLTRSTLACLDYRAADTGTMLVWMSAGIAGKCVGVMRGALGKLTGQFTLKAPSVTFFGFEKW